MRARAARAVRASAPANLPAALQAEADDVSQRHARAVIDLALRMGAALLSTGASASDVVATVLRLTDAYGLSACHVDATYGSLTVSYHRGVDHDPMTVMRIVLSRSADYTRLEYLQALVREIAAGSVAVDEARARLSLILHAPHRYRPSLVTVAAALLGGAVAAVFGGDPATVLVSTLTAGVMDRVQRRLARAGIAAFFAQAVGAAIPTLAAAGLHAAASYGVPGTAGMSPSLVVVAGIVAMLAGMSVLGAAQDAIDGYYVTAGARTFQVIILTLGLVAGVGAVLSLAHRLDVPMELSAALKPTSSSTLQMAGAMVVAGTFAVAVYTGIRGVVAATATAGLGWAVFLLATDLQFAAPAASAVTATTIGIVSQLVGWTFRVPSLAVTTAALVPLLPGLLVYRALFQIIQGAPQGSLAPGLTSLLGAAGVGVGLAAGASMGTFFGRLLWANLDRAQRRALRRAVGDAKD